MSKIAIMHFKIVAIFEHARKFLQNSIDNKNFRHIDLDEIEDEETAQYTTQSKKGKEVVPLPQLPKETQPSTSAYITKVNGSVIIRIG